MKNVVRWIWSILEVIIIVYVILITSFILCRNKYGYTQFGNSTFHNVDLLGERNIHNAKQGDLLIVKNSNDINKGDLIYYYAAFDENYIIRSDYVTAIEQDDYSSLYTVVRNNENVTIASTRVLGKYANTYSKLGGILTVLESRVGFLFLVLLPIMIVFIYQVYEFVVIIRYEKVEGNDGDEPSEKNDAVKEISSENGVSETDKNESSDDGNIEIL